MEEKKKPDMARSFSRREFLKTSTTATFALITGVKTSQASDRKPLLSNADSLNHTIDGEKAYNILMIVVDQERHFGDWPFPVPGRVRLMRKGVSFDNHQIASNVCSPSRSVIYTGQHIQHTKIFDNVNTPWQTSMSTDIPTVGHMLRDVGYYPAYKGKWHLSTELENVNELSHPTRILPDFLERFGFSDYYGIGDIIGETHGGYLHDEIIASTTVRWLRKKGKAMADKKKPWFLAVNLINPHDVMYLNTDKSKEAVQTKNSPVMDVQPPPRSRLYSASWDVPLPESRHQVFNSEGRPGAQQEFQKSRGVLLGTWPDEDWRWRKLQDYYFNCIRDSDRHIVRILDELDDQGLSENTIIIFTSDHGEMGGAHQMHGKGACTYREQNHVPLIIVHPDINGGKRCRALTSHLDLAPTIIGLTSTNSTRRAEIINNLKGHDLSPLLRDPENADIGAIRGSTLFNYNMLGFLDGNFLKRLKAMRDAKRFGKVKQSMSALKSIQPALTKRGAIRSVFNGRYRFSRYFSPMQHHLPRTMEDLLGRNDLELYDLHKDPLELNNLARYPRKNGELIMHMNQQLNLLLEDEVGRDDGSHLPFSKMIGWNLEVVDI